MNDVSNVLRSRYEGLVCESWLGRVIAFAVALGMTTTAVAQSIVPSVAHHDLTAAAYQRLLDKYQHAGFRLKQIDGYSVGDQVFYAAIWEKQAGPAMESHHGMTATDYQTKFNQYTSNGFRLIHVDGFGLGNQAYYSAIWEKADGPPIVTHHGMSSTEYQSKFETYTKDGYRLVSVNGYTVNSKAQFAAIWEKSSGPSVVTHHRLSAAEYQQKFDEYVGKGYWPKSVSGFSIGNQDFYAAIWEKSAHSGFSARHRMGSLVYQNEFDNHNYRGYKVAHVSGYSRAGKAQFAAIWEDTGLWNAADVQHIQQTVDAFMDKHNVPGAALAIVKDGRLVFAQGYGQLDPATTGRPGPHSMFRVASVSKPITGATIMKMVQDKKLSLSDTVFGSGAILGSDFGTQAYSDKETAITVNHLLSHTAGGKTWNNQSNDGTGAPMFEQLSFNHQQLIGWVLDNRDPETMPGAKYDYSNFGYCVLGRIIEKKTGQSYEDYVKDSVLKPNGITNMHIAGDSKAERRRNEAVYVNNGAYTMKVRRMDAHGGWIASPVDLMRFMVRFDGFASKPDMISDANFSVMTSGSTANAKYGKGWAINGQNYFHNGSFSGSGAIIVRAGNGLSWAFVMSSSWKGEADGMMWDVVNGITTWPTADLF